MKELADYYRKRLQAWVAIIVFLAILYRQFMAYFAKAVAAHISSAHWQSWLTKAVHYGDTVLVGVLFLAGEWFLRKKLWKLEMPSWDFSGIWAGGTTYDVVEIARDLPAPNVPIPKPHEIEIEQDCLSISVSPRRTGPYANWSSKTMTILDRNTIGYAYEVNYSTQKEGPVVVFPATAIGYEELKVDSRQENWFGKDNQWFRKGRPRVLSGWFAHCARGQTPVYRGSVYFERMQGKDGAARKTNK